MKIVYTHTDEAPALATALAAADPARRSPAPPRSRSSCATSRWPDGSSPSSPTASRTSQQVADALAELGELAQDARGEHHQAAQHQRVGAAAQGGDRGAPGAGLRHPRLPRGSRRRRAARRARPLRQGQGQRGQPGAAPGQLRPSRARLGQGSTPASTRTRWATWSPDSRSHVSTMSDGDFRSHRAVGDRGATGRCGSSTSRRRLARTVLKDVDHGPSGRGHRRRRDAPRGAAGVPRRADRGRQGAATSCSPCT